MAIIHQLVAGFRRGDAISNEALLIQEMLSARGIKSSIYCPASNVPDADRKYTLDVESIAANVHPEDTALLHLSIGSRSNQIFPTLPCRKVILYHNVTPPQYFERLNPSISQVLSDGLKEVKSLAHAADSVWAVSAFNASELRKMGYDDPKVLPLILDEKFEKRSVDPAMRDQLLEKKLTNLLFVGRLVPNKRHDVLLKVFHAYKSYVNPASRLVIVGSSGGMDAYRSFLMGDMYVFALRDVLFTDFVKPAELAACYATASAFVCMSDHEGFCAPLLEAMAWHVPVFANAAGAVPETLDGAGVLFDHASPEQIAETIGRVLSDPALRASVIAKQDERLARFRARDPWPLLAQALGLENVESSKV